jgi:peptide deformylase
MMICHSGFAHRSSPSSEVNDLSPAVITIDAASEREKLHLTSISISPSDPIIPELVERMVRAMKDHHGDGLAAVQVGEPVRLVLLKRRTDKDSPLVLLNPMVVSSSDQRVGSWEFCLSVPWGYVYVERPKSLRVRYQTLRGDAVDGDFEYGDAVILQQELDHLNGKLLSDVRPKSEFLSLEKLKALIDKSK